MPDPVPVPGEPPVNAECAAGMGLNAQEYARLLEIVGRTPSFTELGIASSMWSEHCSYKSSKKWLKTLPTDGPQVLIGPGENAGVVDLGDGWAAVFKIESHNHPSFIEPYQGAATGVGGIMRDVFTMGARPVMNLNALRFGDPGHPRTRGLVNGVVRGIGGYGNCMGVPTVGGETEFHEDYNGNILVNAMCVGLCRADRIFTAQASGVGSPIVYVGAKTGRDGIHGATMASAAFSEEDDQEKRPTVQVGDPFMEKLLLEACLELMAGDSVIAIQDMGAAGLTSSTTEMCSKGGLGAVLDLDLTPMREPGMTAYELMLSESQERMLMVLKPGAEEAARAIFTKWDLDFAVIGRLTEDGRLVVKRNGDVRADLEVAPLVAAAPEYDRPWVPTPAPAALSPDERFDDGPAANAAAMATLLGGPSAASRRWIWEQYDWSVMADTLIGPGGDAAVVRVHGTEKALAASVDCTPLTCRADPQLGGAQAVAEAYRNLTAVGARPLAVTNNLNFGSPERPEIMGQIVGAIQGMSDACSALGTPVVSGNVSLYNETDGRAIPPTPVIGMVGLIENAAHIARAAFDRAGLAIFLVGPPGDGRLDRSLYLRAVHGRDEGAPPPLDLAMETRVGGFIRAQIATGGLRICHDVGQGGLLIALAEMCAPQGIGATIDAEIADFPRWAFSEDQGRYVVAMAQDAPFAAAAAAAGVTLSRLGVTGGDALTVGRFYREAVSDLIARREGWFPAWMGGDASHNQGKGFTHADGGDGNRTADQNGHARCTGDH